jgi:protein PhnA
VVEDEIAWQGCSSRCLDGAVLSVHKIRLSMRQVPVSLDKETTMNDLPKCPACRSAYTYEDRNLYVCPECAHEWATDTVNVSPDTRPVVSDTYGNVLNDGDTVTVIKDLKVKGTSSVVKVGTRVRNIRLVEGHHDIDCKIDGIGAMQLKSEFVKKAP